jgi:uncharacterized protein (TIGR00730 family)
MTENNKKWVNEDDVIEQKIDGFLKDTGSKKTNYLKAMIKTLFKVVNDAESEKDLDLIQTTLHELRNALKVFAPFRDVLKVCLFGSARTLETDENYQMAEVISRKLTRKGFMVITGAGGGIMEAGNKGSEVNMSFGVNINLPFEQQANKYIINDTKLIEFQYFFNRKVTFVKESDAAVIFPGGFGTHDECFELLTLLQTGRCSPRPVILMEKPGYNYWKKWLAFVKDQLLANGFIAKEDLNLFSIHSDVDIAVAEIMNFYQNYHSIAYSDELTALRLNNSPTASVLKQMNEKFKTLLEDGEFKIFSAKELTWDNKEFPNKKRLVFKFDRLKVGHLIGLIKFINQDIHH